MSKSPEAVTTIAGGHPASSLRAQDLFADDETIIADISVNADSPRNPSPSNSMAVTPTLSSSSQTNTPKPDSIGTPEQTASQTHGKSNGKPAASAARVGPQLIGDLPRAEEDAKKTFVEILGNQYQYSTLGRSREALESMICDCTYEHGVDRPQDACGHDSDCINRLTQVECLPDDCKCRSYCQNQRFEKREHADIHIVQTEKKGFGLRAGKDMRKDTFIYEYVGDVVSNASFMKRMRDYAQEGIRHFYFMMLQKDEFIDATKRGGIGRFANHSCNPNSYVAKWTVGERVRMGIFAHRNIKKDEELTFNYNVDRYGHEPQPCYCGEAKCVGFIGGKTQTDIAGMDDLYLDALGISEEVDNLGLKGNKKKKSRKLDDDYVPELKPLVEKEIPKLVQAMRQTQSRKMLLKLLTRVKITEDQPALRQLMRLRGFSLMKNILDDYKENEELVMLVLQSLINWPLIQRNKVDDSKISEPVKTFVDSTNELIKESAQKLLDHWNTLETAYRIPKRLKQKFVGDEKDGDGDATKPPSPVYDDKAVYEVDDDRPTKRYKLDDIYEPTTLNLKPAGFRRPKFNAVKKMDHPPVEEERISSALRPEVTITKKAVADIIAAATIAAEEAEAARREAQALALAADLISSVEAIGKGSSGGAAGKGKKKRRSSVEKKHLSPEEREANKEKQLMKLVGAIVVKCMSGTPHGLDHEEFKKHAKEIIANKEKKSSSYKEGKLDALSDEKAAKIKKFAKDYIARVLSKLRKAKELTDWTSAVDTHNSGDDAGGSVMVDAMFGETGDVDVSMEGVDNEGVSNHDADADENEEDTRMHPVHAVEATRPNGVHVKEKKGGDYPYFLTLESDVSDPPQPDHASGSGKGHQQYRPPNNRHHHSHLHRPPSNSTSTSASHPLPTGPSNGLRDSERGRRPTSWDKDRTSYRS